MSKAQVPSLSLALLVGSLIAGSVNAQPIDARQIVQQVYEQAAVRTVQMRADLVIYDKHGFSRKKGFLYRRLKSDLASKIRVDLTAPPEEKGVVLLAIQQQKSPASLYVYTPATDRVRSLSAQDGSARFLGSDFTFEDFADRDPGEFSYRLIGEGEKIDGRATYKIEARPIEPGSSQYAYVYFWVAKDVPAIVFAQMYTSQGSLARVLHATDLRREGRVWGPRRTEVSTPAEQTRTILTVQNVRVNPPLVEGIFSPQNLGLLLLPKSTDDGTSNR
jgi:hypothetical protein